MEKFPENCKTEMEIVIRENGTLRYYVHQCNINMYQGISYMIEELNMIDNKYSITSNNSDTVLHLNLKNLLWSQPITEYTISISAYRDSNDFIDEDQKAYQIALDTFSYPNYIYNFGHIDPKNFERIFMYKSPQNNRIFFFIKKEEFISIYGELVYVEFISGMSSCCNIDFIKGDFSIFNPQKRKNLIYTFDILTEEDLL